MIEIAQTRQAQDAYRAAHAARGAAFVGLFRNLFRSAEPRGSYGTVPLT